MAKIINKRTPEIMANRRPTGLDYVSIKERHLYFPKQVAFKAGMNIYKYLHLINDGDYWAFFINDDKDGFQLKQDKPGSYKINDRALVRMFLKSTGKKLNDRLFITQSTSEHNGCKLWEIYTKETVDFIINKQKDIKMQRKKVLLTVMKKTA